MKRITCFIIWVILPFFGIARQPDKRGVILAASSASVTANTYAVVIGISKYKEVTPLKFADRDAQTFADYLLSKTDAALDSAKVKLFLNEKATINNIGNALSDIMLGNLKKGDRIIFFFAGHGDYDANILKDQALLLLYGAPKQNYFQNIFSGDFISTADLNSRFVEPLAAKGCEVMLILDACHATGLNKSLSGGAEGGKITSMALQNMTSPVKLYSCQASEYSLESDQWGGGRGLFSYILMEGLYGMADTDHDKTVTLRELQRYLEDNVPKLAAPNKQNPVVKLEDATQAVSKVNDAFLASYVSEKNKTLTFIAQADPKGSNDWMLEMMDSIQKKLYRDCDSLTASMQLDAAYQTFLLYAKIDSSSSASLQLRRNLSAALQQRSAAILIPLFQDVRNSKPKTSDYELAVKDLEKATGLLGEKNFLYANLQARVLALKAMIILRKRETARKKEAYDYLRRSIELEPNAAYTYYYMGNLFNTGAVSAASDTAGVLYNYDSAVVYYYKYINLIPGSSYAYNNLGTLYQALKKWDESIRCFLKAASLSPDDVRIYYNLGVVMAEKNDLAGAVTYYLKALEVKYDTSRKSVYMDIYNNLGAVYIDMGKTEEGVNSYKKALELSPNSGLVNMNLGVVYLNMKKYQEALLCFQNLVKNNPGLSYGYFLLGQVYTGLKNYTEAMKALNTGLNSEDYLLYIHYGIADVYSMQQMSDSALIHLELSLKNYTAGDEITPASIAEDSFVDNIRALPAFRVILEKYFTKEELEKFPKMYLKK